jgi:shikimate kinase
MNIILTGLPGSGKSTMGKLLASRLNLPFYDLDVVISEQTGQTIPELYSERGEEYFRQIERTCLLAIIREKNGYVLASGGGTPCFSDNLQEMKARARLIFLNTPVDTIIERLQMESEFKKRPLFSNSSSIAEQIHSLLTVRLPYYEQADIVFRGTDSVELAKLFSAF